MSSTLDPTPRPNLHGSNLAQRRLGRPGTRLRSFYAHLWHSWKLRARLERWGSTAEEPGKNDESMPVTPEWQEWSRTRIRFSLAGCVRRKSPPPKLKSPPPPSFFSISDMRSHILHSMLISELKGVYVEKVFLGGGGKHDKSTNDTPDRFSRIEARLSHES